MHLPDRSVCRAIRYYSTRVPDPLERLKFLRSCTAVAQRNRHLALQHPFRAWLYRLMFLDSLANTPQVLKQRLRIRDRVWLWLFRRRNSFMQRRRILAALLVAGLLVFAGRNLFLGPGGELPAEMMPPFPPPPPPTGIDGSVSPAHPGRGDIWLAESDGQGELYSNGLRVLNQNLVHTSGRWFPVLNSEATVAAAHVEWREQPVGIVFHTTESDPAPLEKTNNRRIHYQGRQLLKYIRRNTLYNFVVDRFGRVHRVVPEHESALHAGNSLWASAGKLYVNLNQSFIGISLEATVREGLFGASSQADVTAAQLTSLRMLTEMLLGKFSIDPGNVVTHEMVSISPETMLIGYHTDWKGRFPFHQINMPDNYRLPLPSVAQWGFRYDPQFVKDLGGRVWPGVRLSEELFGRYAAQNDLSVEKHRLRKANQFREMIRRLARLRPPAPRAASPPESKVRVPRRSTPQKGG